jgi:hypothetical protein
MRAKPNEQRERTEQWTMSSGANGYGPDDPSSSPRQSIENARPVQIDLTEDDPADELDALASPGSGNGFDDNATGAMFGAADVTATGADGGPSNEMETGAYMDSLFTQDDVFDTSELAGQQQQQFNFDEDDFGVGFNIQQSGMGSITENEGASGGNIDNMNSAPTTGNANFQTTMPAGDPFNFSVSLPDQTQLAAKIGQDLLALGSVDSTGVSGRVVVPEAEQLAAAAGVEKRKRGEDETDEGMEPGAKRFLSEGSEDGEIAA